MRPRINAADGTVITLLAGRDAAFAIGINFRHTRIDGLAHRFQCGFHAIEHRDEFRGIHRLARISRYAAILVPAIIELVAVRRIAALIQFIQHFCVESSAMAVGASARGFNIRQRFIAVIAALIFAAQIDIKNSRRDEPSHAKHRARIRPVA